MFTLLQPNDTHADDFDDDNDDDYKCPHSFAYILPVVFIWTNTLFCILSRGDLIDACLLVNQCYRNIHVYQLMPYAYDLGPMNIAIEKRWLSVCWLFQSLNFILLEGNNIFSLTACILFSSNMFSIHSSESSISVTLTRERKSLHVWLCI